MKRLLKSFPALDAWLWRLRHGRPEMVTDPRLREKVLALQLEVRRLNAATRVAAEQARRDRLARLRAKGKPIRVLFVAHDPAYWPSHDSIYRAMADDPAFDPLVVAMHRDENFQVMDKGMWRFCQAEGLRAVPGYDPANNRWLDPASLEPDVVFFQQPYPFYPPQWSATAVSLLADLWYTPYDITVFKGATDDAVNDESFLQHMRWIVKEGELTADRFRHRFAGRPWFNPDRLLIAGSPKLEGLHTSSPDLRSADQSMTLLWTPRWRTEEGVCHFFEYHPLFLAYARQHPDVQVIVRHHPNAERNFEVTGEMPAAEWQQVHAAFDALPNACVDRADDYRIALGQADVLITDTSSMIPNVLAMDKPVIYTHRQSVFNELGERMAEGCYWAHSFAEIERTVAELRAGRDPLADRRRQLVQACFHQPAAGAGATIAEAVKRDVFADADE